MIETIGYQIIRRYATWTTHQMPALQSVIDMLQLPLGLKAYYTLPLPIMSYFKKYKHHIIHPFLIGLYFVLYGINQYELLFVESQEVFLLVTITTILGAVLFYGLKLLTKTPIKAGLLTTLLMAFILFYFHFYTPVVKLTGLEMLSRHRYFIPLLSLGFAALGLYFLRSKKSFSLLNQYLNMLVLLLLVFEGFGVMLNYFQTRVWHSSIKQEAITYQGQNFAAADSSKPSVYHILLDAYTGFDALEKHWDFDNVDFKNYLEEKDFYVAAHAQSNYQHTRQAVPAMVNRDYFWDLNPDNSQPKQEKTSVYLIALMGIRNGKTFKDFKAMGYDIINLSIFDILNEPRIYEFTGIPETSFLGFMLRKTVFDVYFHKKRMWSHHKAALETVEELKQIPTRIGNQPTYTYAHLMIPHYPYFFDRDGKVYPNRTKKKERNNKDHYLGQLMYTNKLMQETIDAILENSSIPPIIIIHGDHGFRLLEGEAQLEGAYSVLAAFHFPKQQYEQLHDSISPVNFYRALLNAEFDAQLDMLEDQREFFRSVDGGLGY